MRTDCEQIENIPLFFIGWMPVPDPFYHAPHLTPYYKRRKFLSLLKEIRGIKIDGYMISLNHILRDKGDMHVNTRITKMIREKGLSGFFKVKTEFFLDSGAFQNFFYKRVRECGEMKPEEVFEFQLKLGATKVCHLDVFGDVKKTVENAKIYKELEGGKTEVYYVIQGNGISDYLKCLKELVKIGCERFALGNLYNFRRRYGSFAVVNLIKKVRERIKNNELHLLGVGDLNILLKVKNFITSFDTTYPIRSATLGKTILYWNQKQILKLKPGLVPRKWNCECPVCTRFNIFLDEYNLQKGDFSRTLVRHLRAIHNAYVFKKVLSNNND
jgi:tRNA-guanine family transglycosylase